MYEKIQFEREKMQTKMNCIQVARELAVNGTTVKDIVKDAEILWAFVSVK